METHLNRKRKCPTLLPDSTVLQINDTVAATPFVNSFHDTTYDFLKDKDYIYCINRVILCVPNLIKRIHFNKDHPENNNIYLSNFRNKYISMMERKNWVLKPLDETLDKIIRDYEFILEEWVDNHKDKTITDKFAKYTTIKTEENVIKTVKEEIKLLLYNNRIEPVHT
jgi:hypothetical protein